MLILVAIIQYRILTYIYIEGYLGLVYKYTCNTCIYIFPVVTYCFLYPIVYNLSHAHNVHTYMCERYRKREQCATDLAPRLNTRRSTKQRERPLLSPLVRELSLSKSFQGQTIPHNRSRTRAPRTRRPNKTDT